MLVPNKTISLDESTLYKACQLLTALESDVELVDLYKSNKRKFVDLSSFIDAIDILYVLGKINVVDGVVKVA